jgi:branched-chain amino acid transport system permease protein/urea transport system permease protein
LLDLLEPENVVPAWKRWSPILLRPRTDPELFEAAVSGLAGALFVKQFSFAAPSLIGFGLSTEVLIWVAVGGRNALLAAFLGALLVRSVEGVLSDRLGDYWLLALGMLFVTTVVLMPSGLFGQILMPPVPRRFR